MDTAGRIDKFRQRYGGKGESAKPDAKSAAKTA
jgi:hypothetical protein